MKKALSILLAMGMTVGMVAGCGDTADNSSAADNSAAASTEAGTDGTQAAASAADIKVGVIYIGDENEGYTAAHMAGIDEMAANLGLSDDQIIEKTTIPEDESCYDAAVDLADQGCNIIFATSFGHETYILQAAQEYPDMFLPPPGKPVGAALASAGCARILCRSRLSCRRFCGFGVRVHAS